MQNFAFYIQNKYIEKYQVSKRRVEVRNFKNVLSVD